MEIKVLNLWTIFWQRRSFAFVFAETLYPSETLMQKTSVTSTRTLFFFVLMQSSGIQNTESNEKCWELPVRWPNRKQWGFSALCYFPGVFLSTVRHTIFLKAHPIKLRDYTHTHTQIPLHWVGRLRNLLEFARTAQTQINVYNWCSASLGFLTS